MQVDQGYDVLYLYLMEKFKKANTTPDAEGVKTLKSIMDPTLGKYRRHRPVEEGPETGDRAHEYGRGWQQKRTAGPD
jgi:hypothetical protein